MTFSARLCLIFVVYFTLGLFNPTSAESSNYDFSHATLYRTN